MTIGRFIVCDWCGEKKALQNVSTFQTRRAEMAGWFTFWPEQSKEPEAERVPPKDFCTVTCAGLYTAAETVAKTRIVESEEAKKSRRRK